MKRIIEKIKDLDAKDILTIKEVDEFWMDELSFKKGTIEFLVDADDEDVTLKVYNMIFDKGSSVLYTKELENITTCQTWVILEKILDIVNDKELYKQHAEHIENTSNKLIDRIEKYTEKRDNATTEEERAKYQKLLNARIKRYEEQQKLYLNCVKFEEYEILKYGFDNKVMVQWYREKSLMFPTGKEYSIHTLTENGDLIWGHYYKDKEICREKYKQYMMTDTERAIMKWSGMSRTLLNDFLKYAEQKGFYARGYGDDIQGFRGLYTNFYLLGR